MYNNISNLAMEKQYISKERYQQFREDYPNLFLSDNQDRLREVIGVSNGNAIKCIPDKLLEESELDYLPTTQLIFKYKRYIGEKILQLLNYTEINLDTSLFDDIGLFFLNEIYNNQYNKSIWRNNDGNKVFEYSQISHGDTIFTLNNLEKSSQTYLSFYQDSSPLISSILAYIKSFDTTGSQTLGQWDWIRSFLDSSRNPWKHQVTLDDKKCSLIDCYYGQELLDGSTPIEQQARNKDFISFGLMNKTYCIPTIIDSNLVFLTEDKDGNMEIGRLRFSEWLILEKQDLEKVFLATCIHIARNPEYIPKLISHFFPIYYKKISS